MKTVEQIRSIQALNAVDGYNLTPVFIGESMPVVVKITKQEFLEVKGNQEAMKILALKKINER